VYVFWGSTSLHIFYAPVQIPTLAIFVLDDFSTYRALFTFLITKDTIFYFLIFALTFLLMKFQQNKQSKLNKTEKGQQLRQTLNVQLLNKLLIK